MRLVCAPHLEVLTCNAERLQASSYGNDTDIKAMMDSFERQTKPTFKESSQRSYVKFGSMRDKDPSVGIRCGQLALEAYVVVLHCCYSSLKLVV